MTRRVFFLVGLAAGLLPLGVVTSATTLADDDAPDEICLQVHLPREVTVDGNQLSLEQISVIR